MRHSRTGQGIRNRGCVCGVGRCQLPKARVFGGGAAGCVPDIRGQPNEWGTLIRPADGHRERLNVEGVAESYLAIREIDAAVLRRSAVARIGNLKFR